MQKDILGLQVAVNQPGFMRFRETARNFDRDFYGLTLTKIMSLLHPLSLLLAERVAGQQLHGDEDDARIVLSEVEYSYRVRMPQTGSNSRFFEKSSKCELSVRFSPGQDLQG